jgi:hypothetical protein
VLDFRILRRIFGPKTGWRRLHNEGLHNLYASQSVTRVNKSKRKTRAWHVRDAHKILVEKPVGKRPLGRPRRRWEHNIRIDLREIGWEDVNWIHLTQDSDQWRTLMKTVMNFRRGEGFLGSTTISLSRRTFLHVVKYLKVNFPKLG